MDILILRFSILLLCSLLFFPGLVGQDRVGMILGSVFDDQEQPLPYTNVYIDQSTYGTTSEGDGSFILSIPNGKFTLVVSFVGYETFNQSFEINPGDTLRFNVKLKESAINIADIEVKAKTSRKWRRNLARFKRQFLGMDEFSKHCEIENPFSLHFTDGNQFLATSREPIIIHNYALGYTIRYDLERLESQAGRTRYIGTNHFVEMNSEDPRQVKKWKSNRLDTYQNSRRYLLKSIYQDTWKENGFIIFQKIPNAPGPDVYEKSDLVDALDNRIVEVEEIPLLESEEIGYKVIVLESPLEVFIKRIHDQEGSPYRELPYAFSLMTPNQPVIEIHESGELKNPLSITWFGYFSHARISRLLPVDYPKE